MNTSEQEMYAFIREKCLGFRHFNNYAFKVWARQRIFCYPYPRRIHWLFEKEDGYHKPGECRILMTLLASRKYRLTFDDGNGIVSPNSKSDGQS